MLFQVLLPDESPLTEITLELLCTGMDEHVRCHMGFLGERLFTNSAPVVFLTCSYDSLNTF